MRIQSTPRSAFSWLLRLRWLAVCGQVGLLALASPWFGLSVQALPLLSIALVTVLSNVGLRMVAEDRKSNVYFLLAILSFDMLLLTALLHFSGGPENPFSIVYLLHVVLAAVILGRFWAWAFAAASSALFGLLYLLDRFVNSPGESLQHHHSIATTQADQLSHSLFSSHLFGMWVAYSFVAMLTAYCISRITEALRRIEIESARMQHQQQKLAALTTLAAGAAHEIATPLATISLVLGEFPQLIPEQAQSPAIQNDLSLMHAQVDRCKDILSRMGARYGQATGEALRTIRFQEFASLVQTALDEEFKERVQCIASESQETLFLPCTAIVQSVRALCNNALEASEEGSKVVVKVRLENRMVMIEIVDLGTGISTEALNRVGEPFFSTKGSSGMGLGIFLARLTAERLGGNLSIHSVLGQGTTVELGYPSSVSYESH